MTDTTPTRNPEPMWPTLLALLAAGGLYTAIPENLSLVPRWLVLAVVGLLLVPAEIVMSHEDLPRLNHDLLPPDITD